MSALAMLANWFAMSEKSALSIDGLILIKTP